ncbi:MAG: hypothetical protein JXA18_12485 [Chitinispirillaceae bacterium]|nr:hypothetical protein [Chitinispirillaceae bacterium]
MNIEWGTTTSYGTQKSIYPTSPVHLPNLTPNTTYFYHVWGIYRSRTYEYTTSSFKTSGGAPANKPPVITSAPAVACTTGKTLTYTVKATDADNDKVTFTIRGQPSWITFSSPVLTLKPVSGSVNSTVIVTASDGKGGLDTLNLAVTVVIGTSVTATTTASKTFTLRFGRGRITVSDASDGIVGVSLYSLDGSRIIGSKVGTGRKVGDEKIIPVDLVPGIYILRVQNSGYSRMHTFNRGE